MELRARQDLKRPTKIKKPPVLSESLRNNPGWQQHHFSSQIEQTGTTRGCKAKFKVCHRCGNGGEGSPRHKAARKNEKHHPSLWTNWHMWSSGRGRVIPPCCSGFDSRCQHPAHLAGGAGLWRSSFDAHGWDDSCEWPPCGCLHLKIYHFGTSAQQSQRLMLCQAKSLT